MATAQKGDPLKKQKDSLSFKNKTVDKFWTTALRGAARGMSALVENTGRYAVGKIAKEVRKKVRKHNNIYIDTVKPKPKKKNPMGRL